MISPRNIDLSPAGEDQRRLDLNSLSKPPAWTEDALCAQVGNDDWFPDVSTGADYVKATCKLCAVSRECLTYALDNDERWGIWGGTSYAERRRMRGGDDAA